jgi:hypothetical protein
MAEPRRQIYVHVLMSIHSRPTNTNTLFFISFLNDFNGLVLIVQLHLED